MLQASFDADFGLVTLILIRILGFDANFGQIALIFDTDFGNYLYLCPQIA